jgi:Tfp pilus assembly protein PilX
MSDEYAQVKDRRREAIPKSERGSAMLAALCLAIVFTLCLSSFMALCYTSLRMSTRNLMGARATELAEAGLELAIYSQNNADWTNWTATASGNSATMTMTSTGLVLTSDGPIPLNLGNGATGQVTITVVGIALPSPVFTSSATVTLPNDNTPVTITISSNATGTGTTPVFVNAVAATTGNVKFKQAGTVDSYDSRGGPYTTGGFSAVVLSQNTTSFFGGSVTLNNAILQGYVSGFDTFSPNSINWLSYSSGAEVLGQSTLPPTTIDSTRLITNPLPYQPLFSEFIPATTPTPIAINISTMPKMTLGTAGAVYPSVYMVNGDVSISGSAELQINGPVILLVGGSFYLNPNSGDNAQIVINDILMTNNASLEIHMTSPSGSGNLTINGPLGAGITNTNLVNPYPKRLAFLGTNDTTGILQIGTLNPLYGVFYFPNNLITVNGNAAIFGSLVAEGVTFINSPTIHYDVALRFPDGLAYDAAFHGFQAPISLGNLTETVGPMP